jgi:hypothetical protein
MLVLPANTRTRAVTLTAALIATLAPVPGGAQSLPDARAVLARYVQATNATKLAAQAGQHVKGTFSMPAAGFTGQREVFSDGKGRASQTITAPGIGELREGIDTAYAWSVDPYQGPKIIDGAEFGEMRERQDPRAMLRDPALVVGAESLRRDTVENQPCVKVKLTWKSGRSTTDCYSESTGLLVSSEGVQASPMGDLAYTILYSDYRTFEGITLPTRSVQRSAGTEAMTVITEIVFGPVDPAKLAPPPEIQALRRR